MKLRIASLSLLTICCLMLAVAPAMGDTILYQNGAGYNGEINAYNLGYGFAVSDSFTVPDNSDIETLSIVYWNIGTSDILTTVDMAIGGVPFAGTFMTIAATNTDLGLNGFGYELYQADFTFPSIAWSGNGWITLQNACTTFGCSDQIDAAFWDENDGPSLAIHSTLGQIGSEWFVLDGTTGTTPEPSSLLLLGTGLIGAVGAFRRKINL